MAKCNDIVQELKDLLEKHEGWRELLADSVEEAKTRAIRDMGEGAEKFPGNLDEYFEFLHDAVRWIPSQHQPIKWLPEEDLSKEVFNMLCLFYWILDQPPGLKLQENKEFRQWMTDFANDWGSFLNTTDSMTPESLKSFQDDPAYNLEQYMHNPSGWLTFNQFFAREVKPGLRPVAGMFQDNIITSPADSTFKEKFKIDGNSMVSVKHTHKYNVMQLLEGSPYKDRFRDGLFMHNFLGPSDYHRFHAPVRGTVLECRRIQGNVYLDVRITDGKFDAPDGAGYQFTQTRGLIIFDSPIGLVAVLPIGMAQVSSVNMTAVEGAYLNKGDEFGYFMFGGSDIILLFEASSNVVVSAAPMIHYNTGMCIGEVVK